MGDFGPEAYRFVDFLSEAGQRLWQVLPLNPVDDEGSPYASYSSFAGNPLLLSLEKLYEKGRLSKEDLDRAPAFSSDKVDYFAVRGHKMPLLRKAYEDFKARAGEIEREEFQSFCRENAHWLEEFALFAAIKSAQGGKPWIEWPKSIARREPEALEDWRRRLADEIGFVRYLQYEFEQQWGELCGYCHERDVGIMGDLPIYAAYDSSDVWLHPEFFQLDEDLRMTSVSGVPPDYFSRTGQRWDNPLYRWDVMAENGYRWWIERFRVALSRLDFIRLDHFRGFEAFWAVPAEEKTAMSGRWEKGPGEALFKALRDALGDLPFVAENLGEINREVEELRKKFELPGMSILQFAFGTDSQAPAFRPHNYERNLVAYSGNHDNDTTVGWWNSVTKGGDSTRSEEEIAAEREHVKKYFDTDGSDINWVFIRALQASVADAVVFPLQDVLGLGSEARMNLPGTMGRNWRWRYREEQLRKDIRERLREMAEIYERCPTGNGCEEGEEEAADGVPDLRPLRL